MSRGDGQAWNQLNGWLRAREVQRFHTVPLTRQQNIGEHSGNVAWLCAWAYGGSVSAALLMAALCHDLGEYVTGDIPSPAKRTWSAESRRVLEEVEQTHADSLGVVTPQLSDFEAAVLKWADGFEGLLTCLVDVRRGNTCSKLPMRNFLLYVARSVGTLDDWRARAACPALDAEVAYKCREAWASMSSEIENLLRDED